MKFDCVIMNPPYGEKHLKILKKMTEEVVNKRNGTIISLQPIRWLQDPLAKIKNNSDKEKLRPVLEKKIEKLKVIPEKDVAKYFGDSVGRMDLGIIKVTNNGLFDYDSLSQNSIIDKIRKKPHSIKNNGIKNVVPLSTIINRKRGKGSKFILTKGGYYKTLNEAIEDLLSRNNNQGSALKEGKLHRFSFNTLTEAKNCWEFMQLKSFRAVCSLIFFDVNIKKDYLPLVNDYKKSWTDMDFYKYFGITKQEQQVLSLIIKEKNL